MPIRPEDRALYPRGWPGISRWIRFERAQGRCECVGQCGSPHPDRCDAPHKEEIARATAEPWVWVLAREDTGHPPTEPPITIWLAVAHLDRQPDNCDPSNLIAMCQRCHLLYDAAAHGRNAARTRSRLSREAAEKAGQLGLFGTDLRKTPPDGVE